jgi:hypothetical protein
MNHAFPAHSRRRPAAFGIVLLIAAAIVALVLAPSGRATGGRSQTLRIFEKTRSVQLSKADGRVLKKLPIPEPQAGDRVDVVFELFRGTHAKHGETRLGSDHLRCEFLAGGPPTCVSHAAIGRSMLVVEGTPPRITFGSGRFFGATGRVLSAKEVKAAPPSELAHNDIDVVVRINRPRSR